MRAYVKLKKERLMNKMTLFTTVAVLTGLSAAQASVVVYEDMADWSNAVGNYTTIDFIGGELGTPVLDDYAHFGVTFSENSLYAQLGSFSDLRGMQTIGGSGGSMVSFDTSQQWIGIHYVGGLSVNFYSGDELIYSSQFMVPPSGQNLAFAGFTLADTFDSVYLHRPEQFGNIAVIDNIYIAIPAPGAFGLLLLAGIARTRRRRHV